MLAVLLVMSSVQFAVFSADDPAVIVENGERIALLNSFGKMNYEGKAYKTFRTFNDAFNALGKEGGTIIFTGVLDLSNFVDIEGRGPITFKGIGTKSTSNRLSFVGTEEAPVKEVNIKGDIILDFVTLRLAPGGFLYTNGHNFVTGNGFDTYSEEQFRQDDYNIITYPNPPSVAAGNVTGDAALSITAGTYDHFAAGAVNGQKITANIYAVVNGANVATAVGGNVGASEFNGNANLSVIGGKVTTVVAGSAGGTINGNSITTLSGGEITDVVFGAQDGATINGNAVLYLDGASVANKITAGTGTVTGKKIVVMAEGETAQIADNAANVIVKVAGGKCVPQFDGATLKGYLITDSCGLPAKSVTINGAAVSSANGIYSLSDGVSNIAVTSSITLAVNKNANYVAGYEDGTFRPQNNMTRAEAITLLSRLIVDEASLAGITSSYTDVPAGAWYEKYIGFFENIGVIDNIAYGSTISPTQNITRGEFAELIYRIAVYGAPSAAIKAGEFSDVEKFDKFAPAIYFAVGNGIVTGYEDNTFKPDNCITRAEVVTMANRFLGRTPTGVAGAVSFSDSANHWANGQILAACNPEGVAWTKTEPAKYVITGTKTEDYVKGLYEQSATLSAQAIRDGIDTVSNRMKKDLLATPNTSEFYADKMTGVTYYISEKNGNDDNDGKTPETAFKTIAGLNKVNRFPKPGTSFLFERGGVYRGNLSATGKQLIFGSYGEGEKPVIMQSKRNYADPTIWVETEWKNVYKCTESVSNVGVIAFDHDIYDFSDGTYNELYGLIMNKNTRGFDGPHELCGDLQFYSVLPGEGYNVNDLYVYSTEGNPGSRFESIEIGEKVNIIGGSPTGVIIDNISFKFTGGHGVGFGTCADVTVTNCIFSWLGGSVLSQNNGGAVTNYGNAVEIYGGCDGYFVENNWMYQIYDTAATHQRSASTGNCIQRNVRYTGNLMEYVFWGIEFYNSPPTADMLGGGKDLYKRITEDVISRYNILRLGGYGWGSITRYRASQLYCGSTLSEQKNCKTEYNIFDRAISDAEWTGLVYLPTNATEEHDKNIYVQTKGMNLGRLKGHDAVCDYDAASEVQNSMGDSNAVVIIIDPALEPIVINKPAGLAPSKLS